ncbi:MAG: hypothetical protein OXG68_08430 [Chloroflexi bacterium]|nr:hypothetical protein [Chloroflexota bacterium]
MGIGGKIGKRAVLNADIALRDVYVPAANKLAYVNCFSDMARAVTRRGGS